MSDALLELFSLASVLLLVLAWRRITDPARGAYAMRVAIAALGVLGLTAVADRSIVSDGVVWAAILVGSGVAVWLGRWVSDFRLPQFLILMNGLGGGALLLTGALEYARVVHTGAPTPVQLMLPLQLIVLLGGVTLGASVMVWGRMESRLRKAPITHRFQRTVNGTVTVLAVVLALYLVKSPDHPWWLTLQALLTLAIGVLGALRMPDADVPLAVAWLAAATGLGAALVGLVIEHDGLTAAGGFLGTAAAVMARELGRESQRPLLRLVERALWGAARREMAPPATPGSASGA